MDADLVCAAGFQPALDERVRAQVFKHADIRDGAFAGTGSCRAAASCVAAVVDQAGFDALRLGPTANDGEVATFNCMRPKLLTQVSLGRGGAGENH